MFAGSFTYAIKYRIQYCSQCEYGKLTEEPAICKFCTSLSCKCTGTPLTKAETEIRYKAQKKEEAAIEKSVKAEKKETTKMLQDLREYHNNLIKQKECLNREKIFKDLNFTETDLKALAHYIKSLNNFLAAEEITMELLTTKGLKISKTQLRNSEDVESILNKCDHKDILELTERKQSIDLWLKLEKNFSGTGKTKPLL